MSRPRCKTPRPVYFFPGGLMTVALYFLPGGVPVKGHLPFLRIWTGKEQSPFSSDGIPVKGRFYGIFGPCPRSFVRSRLLLMSPWVRMSSFSGRLLFLHVAPACCLLLAPSGAGRGSGASFCGAAFLCACPGWEGNSSGAVMGTVFTVRAYPGSGMDAEDAERICGEALACAVHWEKVMSAMDAESGLTRLNAAEYGISVPVSPELERVLLLSLNYARLTNGAFDPTLGPCIRLWKKSRRLGVLPSDEERECALRACGWEKLSVRKGMAVKAVSGMRLDLGGMGKGFAVDRMAEMLKTRGICSFFIDSTSDVLAGAPPPGESGWRLQVDTGRGQGKCCC